MRYTSVVFLSILCFTACKPETTPKPKAIAEPIPFIASPAGLNSSLPFLYADSSKTLLSWVEKEGDSLTELKYSEWLNDEWQEPRGILQASDWFVNWADFPAIAENNGSLISHVLKKSSAGTYSYDVKLNLRPAHARQWNTDLSLHTDGTPTEHGFVTTLPYKEGFFITWLDGRNTEEDAQGHRGAMSLRAAEVSVTGAVQNETELDSRICDCCQTTAAITPNGPIVIYRDRSEDEVRDMSIVRWEAGNWTAPKTVYADAWNINGCPVNGPKVAALEHTLAMAWFTSANGLPKVQLIFSSDAGVSFDAPILVSKTKVLGRVDVALLDASSALVSWMEADGEIAQLKAVKVHADGTQGSPLVLTELSSARQSGFPQMELVGDQVLFAWTDISKAQPEVKTAMVPISKFTE